MNTLNAISTLVLVLIAAGIFLRRRVKMHLGLMVTAFVVDLALVLYIEITRHAVEKVVGPAQPLGFLMWFHIIVSTLVLVLYVGQLVLGFALLRGRHATRRLHQRLGMSFCALRLTNYVTSYMIV